MQDLVMSGLEALLATSSSVIGYYVLKSYLAKPKPPRGVPYPPGPTPLPVLGNALAVDVSAPWVTYKKWGSQYGKYFHIMNHPWDLMFFRRLGLFQTFWSREHPHQF